MIETTVAVEEDEKQSVAKAEETKLLELARKRMKVANAGDHEIKRDSLRDLEFVFNVGHGQWDKTIRNDREGNDRVMVTINKLKKLVNLEVGKNRQNRFKPKIQGVDSEAKPETAKIFNGIIRNIEQQSNADIVYDTAYKYALAGGFGYFRVVTQFEEGQFTQEIKLKRIKNPHTVSFDPDASEFNYSDANWCFIDNWVDRKEFEEEYPGVFPVDTDLSSLGTQWEDWFKDQKVRIAEYFYKKTVKRTLALLSDDSVVVLTNEIREEINRIGTIKILRERVETVKEVWWAKITGDKILEGPIKWMGKFIPVIPVLGEEIWVNGKKYLMSLTRDAKDPQRLYNYWEACAAEMVALAPKTPFILTPDQIEGYEAEWQKVNTHSLPYLLYNDEKGLAKPTRERQTEIPTAIVQRSQQASFDIKDVTGKFEASVGEQGNERSGKAIEVRVGVSDLGTFLFPDNMRRAMEYLADVLIDLIPKIYDTERIVQILDEEGNEALVTINQAGGLNDVRIGKFKVISSVGLYSTKKQETLRGFIEFLQYAPDAQSVLAPRIARLLDIDDADKLAEDLESFYGILAQQKTQEGEG